MSSILYLGLNNTVTIYYTWNIFNVTIKACLFKSKFRKQRGKDETAETYFLAGRSMMWWAVSTFYIQSFCNNFEFSLVIELLFPLGRLGLEITLFLRDL